MSASTNSQDDTDAINALRFLAVDAVEQAASGHPGAPMGLAPLAYRLFTRFMRHDPNVPDWFDRDRFVLSNGHASMLLYGALHLSGYALSIEDLKQFRQWNSLRFRSYGRCLEISDWGATAIRRRLSRVIRSSMSSRRM